MTRQQLAGLAGVFKRNRDALKPDRQHVIDMLAIDVANTLNVTCTILNRNGFLYACGHPDFQAAIYAAQGVTKR